MTSPFTDPAPAENQRAGGRKLFDHYGRYVLPDPDTGKERSWTRVTTLAGTLADRYNLEQWDRRMTVKGMALRPDLVALAATLDVNDDDDKKKLNGVAKDAKEAAGSSAGANLGTALHKLTEKMDAGEKVPFVPFAKELTAYRDTLAREGLRVDPRYLERIICVPELGGAGRLDKLLETEAGMFQVGDLKSQKSMEFGGMEIAIQLAIYSRAYAVWDAATETWEQPPPIDQVMATVIHLPVGRGICELYDVDLVRGWEWAKLSADVRQIRKAKPVVKREPRTVTPAPAFDGPTANTLAQVMPAAPSSRPDLEVPTMAHWNPPMLAVDGVASWEARFRAAHTVEELTAVGQLAAGAFGGTLPENLKELGRVLRDVLTAESAPTA